MWVLFAGYSFSHSRSEFFIPRSLLLALEYTTTLLVDTSELFYTYRSILVINNRPTPLPPSGRGSPPRRTPPGLPPGRRGRSCAPQAMATNSFCETSASMAFSLRAFRRRRRTSPSAFPCKPGTSPGLGHRINLHVARHR